MSSATRCEFSAYVGRSRKEHINGESVRYADRVGGSNSLGRHGEHRGLGVLLRVGAGKLLRAVREGVMLWNGECGSAGRSQELRLQVATTGTASQPEPARCHNSSTVRV
jgi:hypothetical protein